METITQFSDVDTGEVPLDETQDADRIARLIRQAERDLASYVGDLTTFDAQLVKDTIVESVLRVAGNPQGFVSEGDADYNYRRAEGRRAGTIYFTTAQLRPFGIGRRSGRSRLLKVEPTREWRGWAL